MASFNCQTARCAMEPESPDLRQVYLGMKMNDLLHLLGSPNRAERLSCGQTSRTIWLFERDDCSLIVWFDKNCAVTDVARIDQA